MEEYDYIFKLIIFGDGGVGKTTLTQRYLTGFFDKGSRLTIGVEFFVKTLEVADKKEKLQIWDFGGEERFRFLLPQYCRGTSGGIFVYDVTQELTFNHLTAWLEVVRANSRNIPLLLVGTKADLELKRKVMAEEAINIARANKMSGFAEVSAKTGQNVESVFKTITQLMVKRANPPA
ncbi:MAG: small GTP-binding protein [Promethearchaeota archaeon CR_4]|nr:MAG: small GTP-binding protein [Candidatus Lokiarchaeota archaeon CR_4]